MAQSTGSPNCGCAKPLTRRQWLAGGAAVLAIGTAPGSAPKSFGQATLSCIDVHHQVSPPTWLDAVKSMKRDNPPMVNWSVQKTLDDMDNGGVATAIIPRRLRRR
jgi:6-methylsalicylate decarboxylase